MSFSSPGSEHYPTLNRVVLPIRLGSLSLFSFVPRRAVYSYIFYVVVFFSGYSAFTFRNED